MREVEEFLAAKNAKDAEMDVVFCFFSERDKWFYEQVLEELK